MSELGFQKSGNSSHNDLTFVRPLPRSGRQTGSSGEIDQLDDHLYGSSIHGSSRRPISFSLSDRLFPPRSAMDSAVMPPVAGLELEHFTLEERIGRGGMGAVFRGIDRRLDRVIALKVLSPEHSKDQDAVIRFQNEARSAAKLNHDNIARVFYIGSQGSLHFIAFEFVSGTNIRKMISQQGRLTPQDSVSYALQIADALRHTAAAGVVHRDIKPSNIIVSANGHAKLVDLGLARNIEAEVSRDLTVAGTALGTFDYIAPEQAMDARNVDVRSDIYSLGCSLFHMLTGEPPYPKGTMFEKVMNHHRPVPPDVTKFNTKISPEFAAVIQKMMASTPSDRYQSPEELIEALVPVADALGLEPEAANSIVWKQQTALRKRRSIQGAPTWAAVVLLLMGFIFADRLVSLFQTNATQDRAIASSREEHSKPLETLENLTELQPTIPELSGTVSNRSLPGSPEATSDKALLLRQELGVPLTNEQVTSIPASQPVAPANPIEKELEFFNPTPFKPSDLPQILSGLVGEYIPQFPNSLKSDAAPAPSAPLTNSRMLQRSTDANLPVPDPTTPTTTGAQTILVPEQPKLSSGSLVGQSPQSILEMNSGFSPSAEAFQSLSSTGTLNRSLNQSLNELAPFVVVNPTTDERTSFFTLSAAINAAKNNWAIEILPVQSDLIVKEPLSITDKQIRIRPARNFQQVTNRRPKLLIELSNQQLMGPSNLTAQVFKLNRAALELYDLDLEMQVDSASVAKWSLVSLQGGSRLTAEGIQLKMANPFLQYPSAIVSIPEAQSEPVSPMMTERSQVRNNTVEVRNSFVQGESNFAHHASSENLTISFQNTALALAGTVLDIDRKNTMSNTVTGDPQIQLTLDHASFLVENGLVRLNSPTQFQTPKIKISLNSSLLQSGNRSEPLIGISGLNDVDAVLQAVTIEALRTRSFYDISGPFGLMQLAVPSMGGTTREITSAQFAVAQFEPKKSLFRLAHFPQTSQWSSLELQLLRLNPTGNNIAVNSSADGRDAGVNWDAVRLPFDKPVSP